MHIQDPTQVVIIRHTEMKSWHPYIETLINKNSTFIWLIVWLASDRGQAIPEPMFNVDGGHMMTSSNGHSFRVAGPLCGEFTGHKGQWRGALMFSLICAWINGWVLQSWSCRFQTQLRWLWRHRIDGAMWYMYWPQIVVLASNLYREQLLSIHSFSQGIPAFANSSAAGKYVSI